MANGFLDRCRTRKDASPLNVAIIRHAAFNILKANKTKRLLAPEADQSLRRPNVAGHPFRSLTI
jgi:hypothetical protein